MMRAWHIGHGHPGHGRIQVEECFIGHDRCDFCTKAARP